MKEKRLNKVGGKLITQNWKLNANNVTVTSQLSAKYFLFLQKHAMVIDSFSESNQKEASMGKDKDKDKGKDKEKKKKKDKKKDKK